MIQIICHHVNGLCANVIGVYLGGFLGSVTQVTLLTEASTPFVNFRALLAIHGFTEGTLHYWNGWCMTFSFLIFRVWFYYYMIFWKIGDMVMYRHLAFWATYPKEKHIVCYIGIFLYVVMYCLQLFWFSKIIQGCLRTLGIAKAIEQTERLTNSEKSKVM